MTFHSRIGNKPIDIPSGVEVKVGDGNVVTVKGPKGELSERVHVDLTIEQADGTVTLPSGNW